LVGVLGVLEDSLEQQRVLGEALHGFDQDVEKSKPLAFPLRLTPLIAKTSFKISQKFHIAQYQK
jgi:hypothetical protein